MTVFTYGPYKVDESQLLEIKELVEGYLSEPYSIFCFRYFCDTFPEHCFVSYDDDKIVGVVIGKRTKHRDRQRGYLGMLAVSPQYRGKGIGSRLMRMLIDSMKGCVDEIVLEAEINNKSALSLYEKHGFFRYKLLTRYYMSGSDAYRLKYFFD